MPEWSWKTTLLISKLTLTVSIRLKDTLELWRMVLYWKYTTVNCCFVWMSIGSESFSKGSFLHEALIREASFKELFDTKIFSCPFFQGAFFSKFFFRMFPVSFFYWDSCPEIILWVLFPRCFYSEVIRGIVFGKFFHECLWSFFPFESLFLGFFIWGLFSDELLFIWDQFFRFIFWKLFPRHL